MRTSFVRACLPLLLTLLYASFASAGKDYKKEDVSVDLAVKWLKAAAKKAGEQEKTSGFTIFAPTDKVNSPLEARSVALRCMPKILWPARQAGRCMRRAYER